MTVIPAQTPPGNRHVHTNGNLDGNSSDLPQARITRKGPPPIIRSSSKEPAHLSLHRRLLFPSWPSDKALPPIIVGKGSAIELLNERIYNLIALLLRAYVLSWYTSISRDRNLLADMTETIILPVLSPIATNIYRHPDRLVRLMLLDVPQILNKHVEVYWQARRAVAESPTRCKPSDVAASMTIQEAYHARLPLPYVSLEDASDQADLDPSPQARSAERPVQGLPEFAISPPFLTDLADTLLRLHLPPKQTSSDLQQSLAIEILGRVILGSIVTRLGQAWFWWDMMLRLIGDPETASAKNPAATAVPLRRPLDEQWQVTAGRYLTVLRSVVVYIWTSGTLSWLFWICVDSMRHAASSIIYSEKYDIKAGDGASTKEDTDLDNIALVWLALLRQIMGIDGHSRFTIATFGARLSFGVLETLVILLQPVLIRHIMLWTESLLNPTKTLVLLEKLEHILLPADGYPGPATPEPSPAETAELRIRVLNRLDELIPKSMASFVPASLGGSRYEYLVDPFGSAGCNAHLVGMLMEAVVAVVEPRMLVANE